MRAVLLGSCTVNIYLVPYSWARHLAVAPPTAIAAILTWWSLLAIEVNVTPLLGMMWAQWVEGAVLLGTASAVIGGMSIFVEMSLRRQGMLYRVLLPLVVGFVCFLLTVIGYALVQELQSLLASVEHAPLVADPSFTSLRFRLVQWVFAGLSSGMGPLLARIALSRRLRGIVDHLGGGLAAGLGGAAVWHVFGYYGVPFPQFLGGGPDQWIVAPDLYLAPLFGLFTWGVLHGLLVWTVPQELYAGWVRVLSAHRFGHRIPVDRPEGGTAERFVGHFPRGLDFFLAAERGVAELHVSFAVDKDQNYTVRGLSQQPIKLKRPLESVDLRYDPRRPSPLETDLHPEDRVMLGSGDTQVELEFLLLPREER